MSAALVVVGAFLLFNAILAGFNVRNAYHNLRNARINEGHAKDNLRFAKTMEAIAEEIREPWGPS